MRHSFQSHRPPPTSEIGKYAYISLENMQRLRVCFVSLVLYFLVVCNIEFKQVEGKILHTFGRVAWSLLPTGPGGAASKILAQYFSRYTW